MLGLPMLQIPRALSPIPPSSLSCSRKYGPKISQDYVHKIIMVVLCIGKSAFTLSTGQVSYSYDASSRKVLKKLLYDISPEKIFFTDAGTKRFYKTFFHKIKLPFKTFLLQGREHYDLCKYCHKHYHRWRVVQRGISKFNRIHMDVIPH
ncbi:hypothetical protein AVEN_27794-1 [Araneus ventricosus]|uniref:Uncharacterized protein n=1 Tax=Araneus ventricosus TaxID=182803 RepID=A0A4Y2EKV7_ARAVE|nr:hypothetical protein AVEN_27794-1 [Araneus ventricosus]